MAAQDMRCVAGSIFYGAPKVPNPSHPQVEYEVILLLLLLLLLLARPVDTPAPPGYSCFPCSLQVVTAKIARTSVERLAKSVVTNHVNELVYDIVNTALEGEAGRGLEEERGEGDKHLQLVAQVVNSVHSFFIPA